MGCCGQDKERMYQVIARLAKEAGEKAKAEEAKAKLPKPVKKNKE